MIATYSVFRGIVVGETMDGVERDYARDSIGSTIELLDNSQSETDSWEYWPYGEVSAHTGSSATPFTWIGSRGYYEDVHDRLYYIRFRFERPVLARWLTVDPLWPAEEAYTYVGLMPLTVADPWGLFFGYGNYCGPRNGNGGTQPPINKVDACCKTHDGCLASPWDWCNPFTRCNCDCALAMCVASNILPSCGLDLKCICGALAVFDYASSNCVTCMRISPLPNPPFLLPPPISDLAKLCFIFG